MKWWVSLVTYSLVFCRFVDNFAKMRRFNTTVMCLADRHYIVRNDRQVDRAVRLVQDGMYFCINRGWQYGKTTFQILD